MRTSQPIRAISVILQPLTLDNVGGTATLSGDVDVTMRLTVDNTVA